MAPARSGEPHKWVVAGTVLTGTIMAVLDSSIVNVALPDIRGNLGVTVEQITWVVTGYILANVVIMPLIALLSERFGRKHFYMASVALFTGASMMCGISRTLPVLVFFRVLQGIGGGVLMTISQAILRETFPVEEQGMAMGIYGLGVVLAPAIGPTLGGWITDQYSWPWIFYVNVPIGALNLYLVNRFVEDPPYLIRRRGMGDYLGVGLMTVGLASLQLLLEGGQRHDWFESPYIRWLAGVTLAGLLLFVVRELVTARPAVELRIFRDRSFAVATTLGGILGMGLMGSLFLLPLFLQNLLGYTAMKSGLALMPRSGAMAVMFPLSGRFYNRLGPRFLVATGLAVSAYSFWELSKLTTLVGYWDIFWPQVWQGVGFSLIFIALTTAALSTISKPKMTAASGLYNVVRQVFGSIGVALSATELTKGTTRFHALLVEHLTPYDLPTRAWLAGATRGMAATGLDAGSAHRTALRLLDLTTLRQAAVMGYNRVFALTAVLFAVGVPLALVLRREAIPEESERS